MKKIIETRMVATVIVQFSVSRVQNVRFFCNHDTVIDLFRGQRVYMFDWLLNCRREADFQTTCCGIIHTVEQCSCKPVWMIDVNVYRCIGFLNGFLRNRQWYPVQHLLENAISIKTIR